MYKRGIVEGYSGIPYYAQWVVWCWRKPVYVGLPLCLLVPVVMVLEVPYIVTWGTFQLITHWGGK